MASQRRLGLRAFSQAGRPVRSEINPRSASGRSPTQAAKEFKHFAQFLLTDGARQMTSTHEWPQLSTYDLSRSLEAADALAQEAHATSQADLRRLLLRSSCRVLDGALSLAMTPPALRPERSRDAVR